MKQEQKDRMYLLIEEHGLNLLEIFPNCKEQSGIKLCKKLRRYENKATILTTAYCNGAEGADFEQQIEAIKKSVVNLLGSPADGVLFVNYDPRGYTLKLTSEFSADKNIYRDWGGFGIIAPDFTPQS